MTPPLVLDASVTLSWFLSGEATPLLLALARRVSLEGALVPDVWHLEVPNVLLINMRRGRITRADLDEHLADILDLPIATDAETRVRATSDTLELADRHRLTVYDAAYLELAIRSGLPLATLDKDLRRAATAEGVALLGA